MANGQTAIMRPLGGLARAFAAMQSRLYQPPPQTIAGVSEQNWPSALQPVQGIGPPGSQPLNWGFWVGINQNITPRPDAALGFPELRALATYPLARICIENVKDMIASYKWDIQLVEKSGESLIQRRKRQATDEVIPRLKDFMAYPDGETPWKEWVRPLLEDMLVIDAACVLVQKTVSGQVVKLRVPDGSEILRLIDDQGYTPAPPSPAYTQLWEGIPRVMLTTDQLVYRPRNIVRGQTVSSQLYGCSPTQQLAPELQIGISRLRYVLAFYDEGAVPGLVQMVPPNTPVDRIYEAMEWMNSELAGNLAKRRQWRYAQSFGGDLQTGPKDEIHQLEEPVLADTYDDLHIHKVTFGYGVSPQRLLKMMNRATANSNQEASQEEGTLPFLTWLKGTMDLIIQRRMGYRGYEMVWDTSVELDQVKQSEIDKTYVGSGIRTINEVREDRGDEPRPEPEANQLMVITATGAVPLGGATERTQESHAASLIPKPAPVIAGGNPKPEAKPAAKPESKKKVVKAAATAPAIHPERPSTTIALAQTKMYTHVARFLFHAARKAGLAGAQITQKVRKAEDDKPSDEEIDRIVEAALSEIDWQEFVGLVEPELEQAAVAGATEGMAELAAALPEIPQAEVAVMTSSANEVAREWASRRAAEMVGMKRVDGELVENPNAIWRIDFTTRNMLRRDIVAAFSADTPMTDLASTIQASGAFSDHRADLIARTEVSNAQMHGNAEAWLKNGNVEEFKWQLSADHVCCDICDLLAANGPYPVARVLEILLNKHPACVCSIIATRIKGVSL